MNKEHGGASDHVFGRVIPILRFFGLAMIICGLAIAFGIGNILVPEIGLSIFALGVIEMIAVPTILQKVINNHRENALMGNAPKDRDRL